MGFRPSALAFGMVKTNFKLIDLTLQLLLDSQSLTLGSLFSFQGCTKRFHSTLVVLPSVVELLFLLSNSSINLLADLAQFKLRSEHLILFLFKSTFSLLS